MSLLGTILLLQVSLTVAAGEAFALERAGLPPRARRWTTAC